MLQFDYSKFIEKCRTIACLNTLARISPKIRFIRQSTTRLILAGGLGAGVLEALFAVTPMETVKTRMIHDQNAPVEQRKFKGLGHAVRTIVANEGEL
jgi:hypothetical protein